VFWTAAVPKLRLNEPLPHPRRPLASDKSEIVLQPVSRAGFVELLAANVVWERHRCAPIESELATIVRAADGQSRIEWLLTAGRRMVAAKFARRPAHRDFFKRVEYAGAY